MSDPEPNRELDLVILGAGATGLEFADIVRSQPGCADLVIGAVDDHFRGDLTKWKARDIEILGDRSVLPDLQCPYLVAVGRPAEIAELSAAANRSGLASHAAVSHSSAVTATGVHLAAGTVLYPQSALSTDVTVGRHCQIHLSVTLGHDVLVGDHCVITPGVNVSGNVIIEDGVFIGTGAALVPGVRIGAGTVVGAGSVVTRDLPPGVVAIGAPAKPR